MGSNFRYGEIISASRYFLLATESRKNFQEVIDGSSSGYDIGSNSAYQDNSSSLSSSDSSSNSSSSSDSSGFDFGGGDGGGGGSTSDW